MGTTGMGEGASHVGPLFERLAELQRSLGSSAPEARRERLAQELVGALAALKLSPAAEDETIAALRDRLIQAAEQDFRDAERYRDGTRAPAAPDPELERLRSENARLTQEGQAARNDLSATQARLQQFEVSSARLRTESEQLRENLEELQRKLDQAQAALNTARQRWQAAEDARMTAESERDALKGAVDRAEASAAELRKRIKTLEREVAEQPTQPIAGGSPAAAQFAIALRSAMRQVVESGAGEAPNPGLSAEDHSLVLTCTELVQRSIESQVTIDDIIARIIFGEGATIKGSGIDRTKERVAECLDGTQGSVEKLRTTMRSTIALTAKLVGAFSKAINSGAPKLLEEFDPKNFPASGFVKNYNEAWRKLQDRRSDLLQDDLFALYFAEPLREEVQRISPL